jgi:hypothetical protein
MPAFQSTLTKYSSPYRPATGLYIGAPIWQLTASSSGTGSSSATAFATKAKSGTGSAVGSSSATGVRIVLRNATSSAVGSFTIVISGPTQLRLGRLTDYSFPYLTGGRYYIGPAIYDRTATGAGTGTQSATRLVKTIRQATGSGSAGASTSTDREILFRSATGSATGSGEADPFLFVVRQGSASGAGSSSATFLRKRRRAATGVGTGTSSAVRLVKNRRSATGSGVGSAVAVRRIVNIRFATASGTGTSSSVSRELLPRTATASGVGSTSGQVLWSKSRIFRVPQTTTYTFAQKYDYSPKERLMAHITLPIRAENLYRLSDGTYTINDPRGGAAVRTYLGAHNIFLDDTEVAELTAAGYGAYIT